MKFWPGSHNRRRARGSSPLCGGDKLTELAALSGIGGLIERSLYILRPLDKDAIREIIVRPAQLKGVAFESDALVSKLVMATEQAEGGLPPLQFALAQLWSARDHSRGIIPDAALDRIGGVAGALARHADGVLDGLSPTEQTTGAPAARAPGDAARDQGETDPTRTRR